MVTPPGPACHLLALPDELLRCCVHDVGGARAESPLVVYAYDPAGVAAGSRIDHARRAALEQTSLRLVCSHFAALLPRRAPPCLKGGRGPILIAPGALDSPTARSSFWTDEAHDLPPGAHLRLTYDVQAVDADAECIGGWSRSTQPWRNGRSGEDALTWYSAPHRHDFTFRTRVFGGFPRCDLHRSMRLTTGTWHNLAVDLRRRADGSLRATYAIDGCPIASCDLSAEMQASLGVVVAGGRFGMMSYSGPGGSHSGAYRARNLSVARVS